MIVNPGIRRFLGSAIQRLFNSASFYAPLTHSLVLERGTGSPTFTRATTATVRDHEGVLRTAIAGEARFEGARRVRNLLTFTEDFSNAAWTKENITVTADQAVAPDGTTTADKLTPSGTVAFSDILNSATVASGRTVALSIYAKKSTSNFIFLRLTMADFAPYTYFNLNTGAVGVTGAGITATITSVGDGWYRCCVIGIVSAAPPANRVDIGVSSVDGALNATAADSIYIWHPQLEDITGRTDQTTPSEYVSVGVLSAPYHGAGVDGVKCFPTDLSGNPIPSTTMLGYQAQGTRTNLCLQSNAFTTTWAESGTLTPTQNVIGPDGATSAWTLTDNDAGVREFLYQSVTLTAATYTFSIFLKKTTGAQTSYPVIFMYPGLTSLAAVTIDTSNGVATPWTAYTGFSGVSCTATCTSFNDSFWRVAVTFTGTAAAWEIDIYPAATSNATQSTGTINVAITGSAVFYGAQVELGSFASSYIATTTVAVTRDPDILTYSSGDVPNLKTLCATFKREVGVSSVSAIAAIDNVTGSDFALAYLASATAVRCQTADNSVEQANILASNAYVPGAESTVCFSVAANDVKMAFDGVAQTQDTSGTAPTTTVLSVGHYANGNIQTNGNVGPVYGWTRNLSQSEVNGVSA